MYFKYIDKINKDLKRTKKAVISLGCSFVEGQGAVDQDLYESYDWHMDKTGIPMAPKLDSKAKKQLVKDYPELELKGDQIDWTNMEYKNSFVNVLCKKYLKKEYTPINFGLRGRGNRASIRSLYLWPDIDWHHAKEIIVIYMPSGQERFDLANDEFNEHGQFHCMWPHYRDQPSGSKRTLWQGYAEAVYSEKSAVLEQIGNVIELKNWCIANDAKLIITPGFDKNYTKEKFNLILQDYSVRDGGQNITYYQSASDSKAAVEKLKANRHEGHLETLKKLVDQWPWDKMFYPDGCETFMDLCLKKEGIFNKGFWDYNGKGTKNHWVTVCCHPSAKAHDLYAKLLGEHINA